MCCLINLPLKSIIRGILGWRKSSFEVFQPLAAFFFFFLPYENTDASRRLLACSLAAALLDCARRDPFQSVCCRNGSDSCSCDLKGGKSWFVLALSRHLQLQLQLQLVLRRPPVQVRRRGLIDSTRGR